MMFHVERLWNISLWLNGSLLDPKSAPRFAESREVLLQCRHDQLIGLPANLLNQGAQMLLIKFSCWIIQQQCRMHLSIDWK